MTWHIHRYELPISTPLKTRKGLLLQTETGWGDIAPLPGWSHETLDEAEAQLRSVLQGAPRTHLYPSVAFGLACAEQPLPSEPFSVPINALLMGSLQEIFKRAENLQGFTHIKLKLDGLTEQEALDAIHALKDRFRIRIDLNRKWPLEKSLRFFSHFDTNDLDYIEEPVSDPADLPHFTHPFALDETLRDHPIKPFLHLPLLKALVIKPTLQDASAYCTLGKPLILSSAFESGLGILHIAALSKHWSLPHPIGLDTYRYLESDVLTTPLIINQGRLHVPAAPSMTLIPSLS
jgi:O-succinylbenzoate synthase